MPVEATIALMEERARAALAAARRAAGIRARARAERPPSTPPEALD